MGKSISFIVLKDRNYYSYNVYPYTGYVYYVYSFSSLGNAYKRLFWDLFGYGEEDNADLVDILGGNASVPSCQNKTNTHRMTEIVGYTFYAAYQITVIVVLLNMLIAMMANSYNNIEVSGVIIQVIREMLNVYLFIN